MAGQIMQSRVWLVLTFGEERQYAGNAGYDDEPGKWYSYDSYVANHRQVSAGDCVILCDRARALGIARIEKIDSEPSTRVLQRCPVCNITGIKKRKTKKPAYRCNDGHEFDEPVREDATCTKYTAHFGDTFKPFAENVGRDFLRDGCPRYSDQLAMQEFEFVRIEQVFRTTFPDAADLIDGFVASLYLPSEAAEEEVTDGSSEYVPASEDERERVLRQIRARRGQQAFRDKLRTRYADRCMISGCSVLHVLEAAHIRPYRGEADNHAENGLLLRADIHTLFDLDLVGIEPGTLTVCVHRTVVAAEYRQFHGRVLPCGDERPSDRALRDRWDVFRKR